MDDNRNNDYRNDNRNQYNRNRNRFRPGGGQGGGHQHRGRIQRPLLTSAINAAGLALVALILAKKSTELSGFVSALSLTVGLFGLSALVSYVAQRMRPKIIEWISDAFFIGGLLFLVYIGLSLGGHL